MPVRVLFLGPLADMEGAAMREFDGPLDWPGLLSQVSDKVAGQLLEARINVACDGKVLANKTDLAAKDGDEVALLPPVSGG